MSHTAHGSAPLADLRHNHFHRLNELWLSLEAPLQPNSSTAAILARDGYRCVYCKRDLTESGDTESSIDHIIPKCRFDSWAVANQDANRVACCRRCNQAKRDWTPSTPFHRAWYDRTYCLKFIAFMIRSQAEQKGSGFSMTTTAMPRIP